MILKGFIKFVLILAVMLPSRLLSNGDSEHTLMVHLQADYVVKQAQEFYHLIDSGNFLLPDSALFAQGFKGWCYLNGKQQLENPRYLTLINYAMPSTEKRLWVIDMYTATIVMNELVAHGERTGLNFARYFSDRVSSHMSSLGFMVTGKIYNGKHKHSLKLHGVEPGYNGNAYNRGIVIHGADYATQKFVNANNRLGRSFGCPAVSHQANQQLLEYIAGGSCLYAFYPYAGYAKYSRLLNADTYIPFKEVENVFFRAREQRLVTLN